MFTPDLDLQVVTRCTKFRIIDKTGADTGDGTGWDGVSGLNRTSVTSAIIRVVAPAATYTDYDVLSQIPDPVTGTITFADSTGTEVDGLHNLIYRIKTTEISISAYADYNDTIANTVLVTAAGHALETGMYVLISGSTSYNGEYYVTVIDTSTFYISETFVADDGASTGTKMFIDTFYPYVFAVAEAGIAKMFANRSLMTPSEERDIYTQSANTARGLLESLKSSITSSNTTALDAILAEITQILSFNSVDPEI